MISPEKEYEFVSGQVRYHNEKIIESFNLFIKLFSGVVGGSIWLTLQHGMTATRAASYARVSDGLACFLALLACLMIAENLRAWHGYRWAQVRLAGKNEKGEYRIPPPRIIRSSVTEGGMMLSVILAVVFYCLFNPFTL